MADVSGQYEISNSKSNIDLGGFDINGSTVFNIFSSDLTFEKRHSYGRSKRFLYYTAAILEKTMQTQLH
ncbi:MAG: hypothetical protein L6V93_05110 [Clostridiales bacterium]|nr:MAG: hypothetical protein L6V93_05110 [Clostridiales bacterium]